MIKVLYLIAGDMSFDEMLFLDAFINQLPQQSIHNHLLVPTLPLSHVALQNRNIEFTIAKPGFLYEDFQALLADYQPQIVILVDPYILVQPDAPDLTYIELEWLDEIQSVVAVLDFRMNLLKTADDQLALDKYILAGETPPFALNYDFLIKVCPPHNSAPTKNPKLLQWSCQDPMSLLAVYGIRDEVRTQLGCKENSHVITLVFPIENTLLALEKGLTEHFPVVIETLIYYLNQLDGDYVLAVVNMPPPFNDFDFDNVQIRFFPMIDMELLGNLFRATEILFTESMTYPGLILSSLRHIPAVNLGSTAKLDKNGQISVRSGPLSPFLQMKLEDLKDKNPDAIFPFLSFPSPLRVNWIQSPILNDRFMYFVADLFDEQRMLALIENLLNKGPDYELFEQELAEYKERKLGRTQDAEAIIRKLVTAPPRHLQA